MSPPGFDFVPHPVTWPDQLQWRRQKRTLALTFVFLPALLSGCLWSIYLPSYFRYPSLNDLASWVLSNLWGAQILLSIWLSVITTLRASAIIAHLRENGNWPLLKIMPYTASEVLRFKSGALFHDLGWPIRLVMALRAASLTFGFLTTLDTNLAEAVLTSIFLFLFCAELIASVNYNVAIGLVASTLARTSAQAQGLAYSLQLLLFLFIFAPLWWSLIFGRLYAVFAFSNGSDLSPAILHYAALIALQYLLASLSQSIAVRRAETLTE